jgi:hypothetical protein
MADIRFSSSQVKSGEVTDILWQQFQLLCNIADVLVAEQIIETATADMIKQAAYDFKPCIEALEELSKVRESENNIRIASIMNHVSPWD